MTVRDNIALPLKLQRAPHPEKTAESIADALGIGHLLGRYPKELSGGEQQKVLIARAFVSGAEVWLLDEPLSMIDIDHRREIIQLLRKAGKTMVIITHNIQDAIDLGGYIYIVKGPPLRIVATAAPGQYTNAERLAEVAREAFRQ
jgi:ABC-type nitrate/sulfonate/bicarbonate transport system, ATPase component